MEFLSHRAILENRESIAYSFDGLLGNRALAPCPGATQWRFLRSCYGALFESEDSTSQEFDGMPAVRAAQLKFEAEDRLRRFYLRPGKPVNHVFTLSHASKLALYELDEETTYPAVSNYALLVREISSNTATGSLSLGAGLREYLERVVEGCIEAEFRAYASLPRFEPTELTTWFHPDGPAMKDLVNKIGRHRDRGWVISNAFNPSTKRLLRINVSRVSASESFVKTTEYWYLRWWNSQQNAYTYSYRETNCQAYVLRSFDGGWRVYENLRPSPRTSAPNRRVRA